MKQYPQINTPADVDIVDYYLAQLEGVHYLGLAERIHPAGKDMKPVFDAVDAVEMWTDRCTAIATLQNALGIERKDPDGVKNCLILPGSETLKVLFDYGDMAEKLLAAASSPKNPMNFIHNGMFDKVEFQTAFSDEFSKNPRYHTGAIPSLLQLLGMMERDTTIMDIRWMAYMLATAFWETTSPQKVTVAVYDKKGKPKLDAKGQAVTKTEKRWAMTMAPVEEVGHGEGRLYSKPVKVKKLENGNVRVTDQQGRQVIVLTTGTRRNQPGIVQYAKDDGAEFVYYGRGYAQLTWWYNYADAGFLVGRGLDFLLNPELVLQPEIAYKVMSISMRTGACFANGKRFIWYFNGATTDYINARRMVNSTDKANEIAEIAKGMERALRRAKR